jgi:threonine aldolase
MNFASDNTAPVVSAVLDALAEASRGYARGYGNDDWTKAAERRFCEVFEREVAAFLVPTGTAANALALAQVSPPWGAILCHDQSHILTDECGAPGILRARRQARRPLRRRRKDHSRWIARGARRLWRP